jgi:hypothetical protein
MAIIFPWLATHNPSKSGMILTRLGAHLTFHRAFHNHLIINNLFKVVRLGWTGCDSPR